METSKHPLLEDQDPSIAITEQFIERYWDQITVYQPQDEGLLIGLPRPFFIPNRAMFQEMYYWDSYFTCLGVIGTHREQRIIDTTENCLALIERFGKIPNSSRFYHLGRSQPPFLSSLVELSLQVMTASHASKTDVASWLRRAAALVAQEYWSVWRGKVHPDHREVYRGLSRYSDVDLWSHGAEAESGWDMTPRFFDRCLDFIPIDLNALLFKYECDLASFAELLGEEETAHNWRALAMERMRTVHQLCWSSDKGFFFDFDFRFEEQSPFYSLAGFFPLWTGLATTAQASAVVKQGLPVFEQPHGLATTEIWHPLPGSVPRQWAWPNGWAPLHWAVVSGLTRYGYHHEARQIARKFVTLVSSIYVETGYVYEKYDVVHGTAGKDDRYPTQTGFGWTNAIFIRLLRYLRAEPTTIEH